MPGYDWNPLRKHRNIACPCESGKKAKHCHGKDDLLPIEMVNLVKEHLRTLSAAGLIRVSRAEITLTPVPPKAEEPKTEEAQAADVPV